MTRTNEEKKATTIERIKKDEKIAVGIRLEMKRKGFEQAYLINSLNEVEKRIIEFKQKVLTY